MPNPLELLRLRNIFQNPASGGITPPSLGGMSPYEQSPFDNVQFGGEMSNPFEMAQSEAVSPTSNVYDVGSRMQELYSPDSQAEDRLNQMLDAFPERNKPGWLRRIGAGLVSYKQGPQAGENFLFAPYERQLRDWKERVGPAERAANIERQGNVNERTLAYQTVAAELRHEADQERANNNERNAVIRQQRADVYEFKAKNPNLKLVMTKGGNVQAFNPVTGETADTGIPTGTLTEADKLALQQENILEAIGARGEETRTTQEAGHEQEMVEIGARGEQARTTKGTPSATSTAKTELPTQTRVRQMNAARQLKNSDPELGKFITIQGSDFKVVPSSTRFGRPTGPTAEQFKKINDAIYGANEPKISQPGRTGTAPTAPPGWKYVPKPGGGWTAVKAT